MSEQAQKTRHLQAQIISPIWVVWFGSCVKVYFTSYHAAQMLRALRLNGTPCAGYDGQGQAI